MNVRALAEAGLVDAWRSGPAIAVSVGLIALGLLFHTEVVAAVTVWQDSTAYNHCFLVIPIVFYLIWDRRDTLRDAVASPYVPWRRLPACRWRSPGCSRNAWASWKAGSSSR